MAEKEKKKKAGEDEAPDEEEEAAVETTDAEPEAQTAEPVSLIVLGIPVVMPLPAGTVDPNAIMGVAVGGITLSQGTPEMVANQINAALAAAPAEPPIYRAGEVRGIHRKGEETWVDAIGEDGTVQTTKLRLDPKAHSEFEKEVGKGSKAASAFFKKASTKETLVEETV
jgi:hypothetical protein